jgi:glycosyltransferase involved in cell wall biosynthesis
MSGSVAPPGHSSRLNQPQQEHEEATVSALMSTYAGETATNLKESLESIYAQTVPPDQLVLVLDGPVEVGQEVVIARYVFDSRVANLTLVRLPSNGGLARAMNAGLERCSGKYIMRADSDDICDPRRLELQLDYFNAHPETDVVTGWCAEFYNDCRPERLKASSVHHDAVARALRWRNVLTHGTVLIQRETLLGVGGYRADFVLLEDYDLYVRLVLSGARFHVIPKVLYRMRTSVEQCRRRGGLRYCLNELLFRFSCLRLGFLNTTEFFVITLMYVVFRLIGGSIRNHLYAFARTPAVVE